MSKIDYSISLEKQHTWTIYQEAPSSALLEKYQIVADNSWYEEYSYTGLRAEVEAQKYFGYKLHCVCTADGVIKRYDLSQARHHDIKYLHDIQDEFSNCVLVGDKGYCSNSWRLTLFEYAGIELATPCRKNELLQYSMPNDYPRLRKRIELVFSQLVEQFSIRKNYAKSQKGFFVKIISKITLFTLLQYINRQNKRPLCQLRYTLSS